MKYIDTVIKTADNWQQSNRFTAFIYAVIKRYGDDQAGYQAALITYYSFLSLFPLLLVVTTITGFLPASQNGLQREIIHSTTQYFPVLGDQLSSHVMGIHKSGLALIVGILFTLYGARGVADALRNAVNHIWWTPKSDRLGFPKAQLNSLAIVLVGGGGFILAAIVAGSAAAVGHGFIFRTVSVAINLFILFWLFSFLLNICLPKHVAIKETRSAALSAAIGLVVLQAAGGYLLARELKNLDALYSYFAIALGLLFWIYLQAQMLLYAVEVAAVRSKRAWPRGLNGDKPTTADKVANEHVKFLF